jgi:hypothetical protein
MSLKIRRRLTSAALVAAATYLLDPTEGPARRRRLGEKFRHFADQLQRRTAGAASRAKATVPPDAAATVGDMHPDPFRSDADAEIIAV